MAPMYYRRANAAMIVYDITREKSFQEAQEWIKGKLNHFISIATIHALCMYMYVYTTNKNIFYQPSFSLYCRVRE